MNLPQIEQLMGWGPLRVGRGGGGGGFKTKFYMGRLRPEVQPLTLLYTIFHGSYNLEKVLNFTSRLEKLLEFGLGPCKVLYFFIRS